MPYIITTSEPFDAAVHTERPAFTRRAVATLDEVWNMMPPGITDTTLARERFALEEKGSGTIGPLPDGTVIEVAPVEWSTLIAAEGRALTFAPAYTEQERAEIIDAYNARATA